MPSFNSSSACSRFNRRNSLAAKAGNVTARAFSLSGAFARRPALVYWKLPTTHNVPLSRSTCHQRNAWT